MSEKRIKTKEEKKLIIYDIIFFVCLNIFTYIFHSKTIIDFVKVCPRWGCIDAESDDICDNCEYFKILDFHKGGFGYQDWFTIS